MEITKDTLPIDIEIIGDKGDYCAYITEHEALRGTLGSGKTEEEAKIHLRKMMHHMLRFYAKESKDLRRLAIFQGNKSRSQIWFTIIGIGLQIYIKPKNFLYKSKNSKGLWLFGKVRITFMNFWKKPKIQKT